MSRKAHMLPVWFFIGVTADDLWMYYIGHGAGGTISRPTAVVLAQYHPGIFGGILLLLIGGFYTIWFWPGRRSARNRPS